MQAPWWRRSKWKRSRFRPMMRRHLANEINSCHCSCVVSHCKLVSRRTRMAGARVYRNVLSVSVLWSMLIQELHDATRETLSNFIYKSFKITRQPNKLLQCLREMRVAVTNYRMQTGRRCLRAFGVGSPPLFQGRTQEAVRPVRPWPYHYFSK